MDTVTQLVEPVTRRRNRRHPLEFKRSVVEQTFEPGASVARVSRDNDVNANQVWAWRRLYEQGLLVDASGTGVMLPVFLDDEAQQTVRADVGEQAHMVTRGSPGVIEIQHGKSSIRIEGVPDQTVLRHILERVLR